MRLTMVARFLTLRIMFSSAMYCILLMFLGTMAKQAIGDSHKRIAKGHTTDIKSFPYQVMVLCENGIEATICGGALLSKTKVLTAAHCIQDCDEKNLQVIAGVSKQPDLDHEHKVNSFFVHPEYDPSSFSNDIAIICLEYTLTESDRIKHISIVKKQSKPGTKAVVTGWGKTESQKISSTLRYANVTVIQSEKCRHENLILDETQICTDSDGVGPCQGDSGGPLVANHEVIGVVSYGSVNCDAKFVRMYTGVYYYKTFIESHKCKR